MKRIFSFLTLVALATVPLMASDGSATSTADAFGIFALLTGATALLSLFMGGMNWRVITFGLMATVINATALNTAYQAEYRDSSKNLRHMRTLLYEQAEFDQLFTVEYIKESVWERAYSGLGSIIQRFQIPFTPNGTLTLTPSKIELGDIKADILTSSHELKRSWAGFLHKNDNTPQTMQAFIKWLTTEHLPGKWNEDIELYCSYNGVQQAVVANTAGTAIGAMNGFKYVINDHITNGRTVPVAMGAVPTVALDLVNYVEELVLSAPNVIKKKPMNLVMSLDNEELFAEGMRLKYNLNYRDVEDVMRVYKRKNVTVVGSTAMGTSDKMWMSFKDNLIKPVNLKDNPDWRFEDVDRSIKIFTDKMVGYGVWIPQYLVTNDVELTNESSD
jgi:hypothetical protein